MSAARRKQPTDASRQDGLDRLDEDLTPSAGRPVYTLAIASQLLGLAPRTLRAYEEAGLLNPARSGRNNQRLYSPQDLRWLRCIYEMVHDEGYNLRSLRRLLDFVPCWEIRRCPEQVRRHCAPFLRIPDMAEAGGQTTEAPASSALETSAGSAAGGEADDEDQTVPGALVHVEIIYGLVEFGTVMHCSRCLHAERVVRRVAAEYGDRVLVSKHDLLSREARRYGVLMTPTLVINGEIVSVGKSISEARLRELIDKYLAAALRDSDDPQTEK